jgi:DNA topoisomerase-1
MVAAARAAGLHYLSDRQSGIRRKRAGRGFTYIAPDGAAVRDKKELGRFTALAIPPAWTDVWISPNPRGHIQATGRDAKGRKQYRYHPQWQETRGIEKYEHMIAFAEALPRIRRRVQHDLELPGLPHEKVLATIVRLLDETLIRIGNREYARQNASFGLTTLRNKHADVSGRTLRFQFRGKGGKARLVEVSDRRVASIVRRCLSLPGQSLFEYVDEAGKVRAVDCDDVNGYLRDVSGDDFTAKDFRTWGGTVVAARTLRDIGDGETQAESKQHISQAIQEAAAHLGNTPAICRESYVHPGMLEAYLDHTLVAGMQEARGHFSAEQQEWLRPDELQTLALLRQLAAGQAMQSQAS